MVLTYSVASISSIGSVRGSIGGTTTSLSFAALTLALTGQKL